MDESYTAAVLSHFCVGWHAVHPSKAFKRGFFLEVVISENLRIAGAVFCCSIFFHYKILPNNTKGFPGFFRTWFNWSDLNMAGEGGFNVFGRLVEV